MGFFREMLVHTKGPFARQAFVLDEWQEWDIIRPLFGEVIWSAEWGRYVRRYTVAWVIVARKNGKSELAAGVVLLLLVGDDEESAEVYGAAIDRQQAGKVGEVVERMRQMSPELARRLEHNKNNHRTSDEASGSYYEVIPADALGNLGHNPHGFVLDELLSQPDGTLWDALRTATGTRTQPLFLGITTETDDPSGWAAGVIDEAERIEEDPARSPHTFAYVRKMPKTEDQLQALHRQHAGDPRLPVSLDPWDEANWAWPNPALGSFLSRGSLREAALEAKDQPARQKSFLQFRLNQRQATVTRWMPLDLWDRCAGLAIDEDRLEGRRCFGGLDLAATTDLAALAWIFDAEEEGGPQPVIWRYWMPEAMVPVLDKPLDGQVSRWVAEGFISATEGDLIDYEVIKAQLLEDSQRFRVADVGVDRWNATGITTWMAEHRIEHELVGQGFVGISAAAKELMRLTKGRLIDHGGNPVSRWNAEAVEVKQDDSENIRPVKPARGKGAKRIDGMVALMMAIDGLLRRGTQSESAYESHGLRTA